MRVCVLLGCLLLAACQSSQSRKEELATICANPANRAPGQFYFGECEALYPLTPAQRAKLYYQAAPQ